MRGKVGIPEVKKWYTDGNTFKIVRVRKTCTKKIIYFLSPTHFAPDKEKINDFCKITNIIDSTKYLMIPFLVYLRSPNVSSVSHVTTTIHAFSAWQPNLPCWHLKFLDVMWHRIVYERTNRLLCVCTHYTYKQQVG